MSETNNPVRRLQSILRKLKNQNPKVSLIQSWGAVLNVDQKDHILLVQRIASVMTLIPETKKALLYIPEHEITDILQHVNIIAKAFQHMNLKALASNFLDQIPDSDVNSLTTLSKLLDSENPEISLAKDNLDSWLKDINDLYDEVNKSDEDPQLKGFISSKLYSLIEAIEAYQILGAKPIEELTHHIYCSAYQKFPNEIKSENKPGILKKLLAILNIISTAINIAQGTMQLSGSFSEFLPWETAQETNVVSQLTGDNSVKDIHTEDAEFKIQED